MRIPDHPSMPRRSWTGQAPRLYDLLTAPLERLALGRWRRRAWSEVPGGGLGLEVGAGTGANFPLHPPGARVVALDVSPDMLLEARRRGGTVPLVAADVQALPFRDASFDWAAATLVFCEVADPVAGLAEVRRVTAGGGRLVLLEHVRPTGWLGRLARLATRLTGPLFGEHFDRRTEAAARAAGFAIDRRAWLWRDAVVLLVARPMAGGS